MLRHEMVRHKMRGDIATHCKIAVASVAADPGHLESALIDMDVVHLVRVERGIVAGDRNVDGRENCDGVITDTSEEMAVAAVAGFVVTGIDHIGAEPEAR